MAEELNNNNYYEKEELSILDYFRIIKRYKYLIAAVFILIVAASFILSFFEEPVYEATSVIIVSGEREQDVPIYSTYQSIREAVDPRTMKMPVSEEIGEFYVALVESDRFAHKVAWNIDRRLHPKKPAPPLDANYEIPDYLKFELIVKSNEPRIIRITITTHDAELAAMIANEYYAVVEDYLMSNDLSAATRKRMFIEDRLISARDELRRAEEAGKEFLEEYGVISDPESELSSTLNVYTDLRTELALSKVRLASQISRRDAIIDAGMPIEGEVAIVSPDVYLRDLAIVHLRNMLVEKEVELTRAEQLYYHDHPKIRMLQEDLESLKMKFKEEIKGYNETEVLSQDINIVSMNAKVEDLERFITDYNYKFAQFPSLSNMYQRLFRDIESKTELVNYLTAEYETAKIEEARQKPSVEMLDEAPVPKGRSHPRLKLRLLISGVLAICLGVCIAFFLDYIERERLKESSYH